MIFNKKKKQQQLDESYKTYLEILEKHKNRQEKFEKMFEEADSSIVIFPYTNIETEMTMSGRRIYKARVKTNPHYELFYFYNESYDKFFIKQMYIDGLKYLDYYDSYGPEDQGLSKAVSIPLKSGEHEIKIVVDLKINLKSLSSQYKRERITIKEKFNLPSYSCKLFSLGIQVVCENGEYSISYGFSQTNEEFLSKVCTYWDPFVLKMEDIYTE